MKKAINRTSPARLAKLRGEGAPKETNFRVAAADGEATVYLYDVIGWPFITAQDLLYRIPSAAKKIFVHINSPGGDVFEGMAIYNLFLNHKASVDVFIDALAASSGSLIAMSGDKIHMAQASMCMIHNPWSMISGDAEELRQEADLLDKISNIFAGAYERKFKKSKKEILKMMKAETWFTPEESVEAGFADGITGKVEGAGKVAASFDLSVFNNTPQFIRQGSAFGQVPAKHSMEEAMNKKLRALLERLGLAKDSTEEEAVAFLAGIDLEKVTTPEEKDLVIQARTINPQPAGVIQASAVFSREDLEAEAKKAAHKAAADERVRAATIREDVKIAGLDESFANGLIDQGTSVDVARGEIMAKLKTTSAPLGSGRFTMGDTDGQKFRAAAVDGLLFRTNARAKTPAPGHETFKAASLEFIARQCLERAGINTSGLATRDQVAREIMKRCAQGGGFSTDDFSSIFMDVANKSLLRAYEEAPSTWRPFVNVVSASDFKTMYGVSLSDAPELELITEQGEYKEGKLTDNKESYSVKSYGKMVYLTRVMIVNDDMRAFTRIPQMYGAAARRKESDLVWGKITGNPTMNDTKALFHADHANLEATTKGVIASNTLTAGRLAMRKQKGPNGARLDLRPAFVLLPVAQETDTDILLLSAALPSDNKSSGVHNPWNGKLTPISDPRLDDVSAKAWYLVADPSQTDTIEVAYLDGNEQPYTEEQAVFERDAVGFKIRHDLGVGIMGYRGFYKNPGE